MKIEINVSEKDDISVRHTIFNNVVIKFSDVEINLEAESSEYLWEKLTSILKKDNLMEELEQKIYELEERVQELEDELEMQDDDSFDQRDYI